MKLQIKCNPHYNETSILSIFNSELDLPIVPTQFLAETILEILMGTRQIREGSKPGIDYQFAALQKIRKSIEHQATISMVIPAGPKKPGLHGDYVDLAEYWFLRILHEMAIKVDAIYTPGIVFTIILEDASMELFEPELPKKLAISYRVKLEALIGVLGYGEDIHIVPESQLVNAKLLKDQGAEIYPYIHDYIRASSICSQKLEVAMDSLGEMYKLGWNGSITLETLEYYIYSFSKNYPEKDRYEIMEAIALYLSTSYARYKLNARRITDNDLGAANAKRVPGVQFNKYDRIFYRTMPLSKTKVHIPFWRSRGIIVIENGEYESKLFPFNQTPDTENTIVTLTNSDGFTADIRIDIAEK